MGIVAMTNSFLMLAAIFPVLGTNTSILRLIPEHMLRYSTRSAFTVYNKIQYLVVGVSLITGGILYFTSNLVASSFFSKPHLSSYFALASVFVVFVALMNLNTEAIRGLRLIRTYAFVRLTPSLSQFLILSGITVFFFHPDDPIFALLASFVATALAGSVIMQRGFKKRIKPLEAVSHMPVKSILSISFPMLMTTGMNFIMAQAGVIMLGMYRSEEEVAYYAIAVKLATLNAFLLSAVNSMAAPKFSELFNGGQMDELFYVAKKSTKLIFWATTPILFMLILLGKPLLGVLFGHRFIAAYGAMVLLVIGQFVNAISGSTAYFMNMTGHQRILRNIIFGAAMLNLILNFELIPTYGINGSAFAAMVSLTFWNITTLTYIKVTYGRVIGYLPFFRLG